MTIIILLLILVFSTSVAPKNELYDDHFSVSQTRALKGLFAICIVFHHLSSYLGDTFTSLAVFKYVGFFLVGGFFFISGYGLTYGALNKPGYMKGFLRRRFLPVFFTYTVIDLCYWASNYICGTLTLEHIIKSFFGLNSNLWFASVILWLYIAYYLCFRLFGNRGGLVAMTVCVAIYIAVLFSLYRFGGNLIFGFWWYNSIPCFALGMWYSAYREKVNAFIRRRSRLLIPLAPMLTAALFAVSVIRPEDSARLYVLASQILCALAFSASTVILSMKLRLGGSLLSVCGDLSLELYLFHAVFIFFWRSNLSIFGFNVFIKSDDLFFAAVILWTFVASYAVHMFQKLFFRRKT